MQDLIKDLHRIADEQEVRKDQELIELAASILDDLVQSADKSRTSYTRAKNKVVMFYNPRQYRKTNLVD